MEPNNDPGITLRAVENLARECDFDQQHSQQVTRLALQLFDELRGLHQLELEDRLTLQYAGLLHDIGWIDGRKGHHKASLNIILSTPLLPFDSKQRYIIGSIARYHRKSMPDPSHDHFAALDPEEQHRVCILAALLRVADGLDSTHQGRVRHVKCKIKQHKVLLECAVTAPTKDEAASAEEKGDLFEQVFKKKIEVSWKLIKE